MASEYFRAPHFFLYVGNGLPTRARLALGELVAKERAERLEGMGIHVGTLVKELARKGIPLAIELTYLLDSEEDFEKILKFIS